MNNSFIIDMVVEIPKGGCNKYEYDVLEKTFKLDRVLPGANYYPGEYGFIKNTLDFDGDPLDVIALSTYPTFPGCIVTVRVLGEIHMIDEGEEDTKLFGVLDNDPRFNHITSIDQVSKYLTDPIIDFFQNYKNLQNKKVAISGINDIDGAKKTLLKCQELFNKYKYLIHNNQKKELMMNLNEEWNKRPKTTKEKYQIRRKFNQTPKEKYQKWIKLTQIEEKWFPINIKTNTPNVSAEIFTSPSPRFKILKYSTYYTQSDPRQSRNKTVLKLYQELEFKKTITITEENHFSKRYKITFEKDCDEFKSTSCFINFLQCQKISVNGWEWLDQIREHNGSELLKF